MFLRESLTFVTLFYFVFASVSDEFVSNEIDKTFSIKAPDTTLKVKYKKFEVEPCMTLKTLQIPAPEPDVTFDSDPDKWYTLFMLDSDAPSRKTPLVSPVLHWLAVNIAGDGSYSQTLAPYMIPKPPHKSGLHRYTFLLFEQQGKIDFKEKPFPLSVATRRKFDFSGFVEKYNLGNPIAGNCFLYELLNEVSGTEMF